MQVSNIGMSRKEWYSSVVNHLAKMQEAPSHFQYREGRGVGRGKKEQVVEVEERKEEKGRGRKQEEGEKGDTFILESRQRYRLVFCVGRKHCSRMQ